MDSIRVLIVLRIILLAIDCSYGCELTRETLISSVVSLSKSEFQITEEEVEKVLCSSVQVIVLPKEEWS